MDEEEETKQAEASACKGRKQECATCSEVEEHSAS